MESLNNIHPERLDYLIKEYEAMSHKGSVPFYEEAVFLHLLDYYEKNRKWGQSLLLADEAISQHRFSPVLYVRKAQILLEKDLITEALVTLKEAEVFSPRELAIRLFRAELLSLMGESEEALNILDTLKDFSSREERAEIYFSESQIFENRRQYREMFVSLKRCLLANSRHQEAAEKMIWAVEYTDCHSESVHLHQRITDEDPYNAWGWFNLGYAHKGLGEFEEAVEAYEFAIVINERFELAYRECAEIYLETRQYAQALKCFENSMEFFVPDSDALHRIGFCYEQIGRLQSAHVFYQRALELNPRCAESHYRIGVCLSKEEQWDLAIAAYLRAIQIDDRREEFYEALGDTYYRTNKFTKAILYFKKAAHTAPDEGRYWTRLASSLMNLGFYKRALCVLDEAELYTESAELKYCRVVCLILLGKDMQALFILRDALEADYAQHTVVFDWRPELVFHEGLQSVIKSRAKDEGRIAKYDVRRTRDERRGRNDDLG